jgi:hypothetical protein
MCYKLLQNNSDTVAYVTVKWLLLIRKWTLGICRRVMSLFNRLAGSTGKMRLSAVRHRTSLETATAGSTSFLNLRISSYICMNLVHPTLPTATTTRGTWLENLNTLSSQPTHCYVSLKYSSTSEILEINIQGMDRKLELPTRELKNGCATGLLDN